MTGTPNTKAFDLPQVPTADAIRTTLMLWETRAAEHPSVDQLLGIIRTRLYYLEQENAKKAADLATAREVARGNKRHYAEAVAVLDRIEKLLVDTDGGKLGDGENIPVGEINRALYEPIKSGE